MSLVGKAHKDFDGAIKEFWDYVKGRLKAVTYRVHLVYSDLSPNKGGNTAVRGQAVVEDLIKNGAQYSP